MRDVLRSGIYSACTANEWVLEAVLERAKETGTWALIEATANQVDQYGGYTGMKPADFAAFVRGIAQKVGWDKVILGGDHLGPLTWTQYPEAEAMARAEELVRQYAAAGFTKIHLDTSMRVADDDAQARLPDEIIARRAARLAKVCDRPDLTYVIGSEVPIPGGAQGEEEEELAVTTPQAFRDTYHAFEEAFQAEGLTDAFSRVVGVVVQPGVEFGDASVHEYDAIKAKPLTDALKNYTPLVFEGHSTDYQTPQKLREMVRDGIAILKVGPALTFALREGLFALAAMEDELVKQPSGFRDVLERVMLAEPKNWQKHYQGTREQLAFKRKYSFSDRARYYLPHPEVQAAMTQLMDNLKDIPLSLLSQAMPVQYTHVRQGQCALHPLALVKDRVKDCIDEYLYATK